PGRNVEAFRQGLRDLGYIEGKNIFVEYRYAEGVVARIPSLVAELVQLNVDVLVSGNFATIRAAKQATKTIPIVIVTAQDPVAAGLVDSLARPGGNITGLALLTRELSGKRLELLKEIVPKISRVGIIWDTNAPGPVIALKEYKTAAQALKILLLSLEAQEAGKIPRIAYVSSAGAGDPSAPVEAFRQGLRNLGYVEGKNILVEYRYLEGKRDRISGVVAEQVQLKVDVFVVATPPAIRAIKQATRTIPIVIITSQDPVAAGYVESLARPGGNITGVTRLTRDL